MKLDVEMHKGSCRNLMTVKSNALFRDSISSTAKLYLPIIDECFMLHSAAGEILDIVFT